MEPQKNCFNEAEQELLRARFTLWLDTVLSRASARYREQMEDKLAKDADILSIDALPPDCIPDPRDPFAGIEIGKPDFAFEEERLAQAFSELSLMRKEVLRLLFVERMKPKEIAMLLRCSENYVNVQKKRALKELRQMLAEGGYADE